MSVLTKRIALGPERQRRPTVFAYLFSGYWVDVGMIAAYWEANLALLEEQPALNLYDSNWVINTRSKECPPVKVGSHRGVHNSLLSTGCIVNGTVINSVLPPGASQYQYGYHDHWEASACPGRRHCRPQLVIDSQSISGNLVPLPQADQTDVQVSVTLV